MLPQLLIPQVAPVAIHIQPFGLRNDYNAANSYIEADHSKQNEHRSKQDEPHTKQMQQYCNKAGLYS